MPAVFASFEISMLSLKFVRFREFCFCSVAAKFARFYAPTRFFGQRSFAIFSASFVVSVQSDYVNLWVIVSSLQHAPFMGSCHFCEANLRASWGKSFDGGAAIAWGEWVQAKIMLRGFCGARHINNLALLTKHALIRKGYVIYSPRGINHITPRFRPINGLFLHWRGFLKGCKNTLTKNAAIVYHYFVS